jgi:hypothetical protein
MSKVTGCLIGIRPSGQGNHDRHGMVEGKTNRQNSHAGLPPVLGDRNAALAEHDSLQAGTL